jgi:hypothetical protein
VAGGGDAGPLGGHRVVHDGVAHTGVDDGHRSCGRALAVEWQRRQLRQSHVVGEGHGLAHQPFAEAHEAALLEDRESAQPDEPKVLEHLGDGVRAEDDLVGAGVDRLRTLVARTAFGDLVGKGAGVDRSRVGGVPGAVCRPVIAPAHGDQLGDAVSRGTPQAGRADHGHGGGDRLARSVGALTARRRRRAHRRHPVGTVLGCHRDGCVAVPGLVVRATVRSEDVHRVTLGRVAANRLGGLDQ